MGANFGGKAGGPIDPWQDTYSQQGYGLSAADLNYQYHGLLGAMQCATGYATYSGMGMQQHNAQMHEMQTHLGTPVQPKPTRQDPEEIAWLKGRIKEVEWRG
jgi:hypothetical protein